MSYELYPWFDDEWVAEQSYVNRAVYDAAIDFAIKWKDAMGPHSRTGAFARSIGVERANDKDYWVYAGVRYGVWAEYGHQGWVWDARAGEMRYIGPVRGIHVLRSIL